MAIPGWILALRWFLYFIGYVSDIDFVLSAGGNPRVVWFVNFVQTPLGITITMLLGFCWLAYLVWRPVKALAPQSTTYEIGEKETDGTAVASQRAAQTAHTSPQRTRTVDRSLEPVPEARPEPNIICRELDEFVKFEGDNFHSNQPYDKSSLRVVGAMFSNEPNPPQKVGSVHEVEAQIIYYNLDYLNHQEHKVHHAYWIDDEHPHVSFEPNAVRKLVIGIIDCDNLSFTIYHNNHESVDKYRPALKHVYKDVKGFRIKVRLIAGEHGEWGKDFDFVLWGIQKTSYMFNYLTEEFRKTKREAFSRQLKAFIDEGDRLFGWHGYTAEDFFSKAHQWRDSVEAFIKDNEVFIRDDYTAVNFVPLATRFLNVSELKRSPRAVADVNPRFLDVHYTRLLNLKEIAKEYGAG